jgi:arginine repressor
MTEPRSLGHCHACGVKLSQPRLLALLRRRALERLVGLSFESRTHAALAQALTDAGFPATKVTVTKDLKLLGAIRVAEVRYRLNHPNTK